MPLRLSIYMLMIIIGMMVSTSCSGTPDGVLGKDDMVNLLADMHKSEGVIDMQRQVYSNDSMKILLRESLYAKYGLTSEQVDSSFSWYGNHIDKYMEVYADVIKKLEDEIEEDKTNGSLAPVYAEGDSVDIWNQQSIYRIDFRSQVRNVTFNMSPDENWKQGDNFTLQFKMLNKRDGGMRVKSSIFVKYDDGEIDYRESETGADGWSRLKLVTDSTKTVKAVYGSLSFDPSAGEIVYLDSVGLVRTRLLPQSYYERGNVRHIHPFVPKAKNDSTRAVLSQEVLRPINSQRINNEMNDSHEKRNTDTRPEILRDRARKNQARPTVQKRAPIKSR